MTRELEVAQHLSGVDCKKRFDRLDLDDHELCYDEIEPQKLGELGSLVVEGDPDLPLDGHFSQFELSRQTGLIDTLEETRSELAVDGEGSINNLGGSAFSFWRDPPESPSLCLCVFVVHVRSDPSLLASAAGIRA